MKQINKRNNKTDIMSMVISGLLFFASFVIMSKITPAENIQLFSRNIAVALLISIINMYVKRIATHNLCVNRFVLSKERVYTYNIRKVTNN